MGVIMSARVSYRRREDLTESQLYEYTEKSRVLDWTYVSISPQSAEILAKVLQTNTTLQELYFSVNDIGDQAGKGFGEMLRMNSTLKILDLGTNKLTDEGLEPICSALVHNTALTALFINVNDPGEKSVAGICEALQINTTLSILGLRGCGLGPDRIEQVMNALSPNKTLTHLQLDDNGITDDCMFKISSTIAESSTLTSIKLSKNPFGITGWSAFCEALKTNTSLTELSVIFIAFGHTELLKTLGDVILVNTSLQNLTIDSLSEDEEINKKFIENLSHNTTLMNLNFTEKVFYPEVHELMEKRAQQSGEKTKPPRWQQSNSSCTIC